MRGLRVKGLLVRVGIDQEYGGWNAPVDSASGRFVWVPIPDRAQRRGLETPYTTFATELAPFPECALPSALVGRPMHLDPDFEHLTYGDSGDRRGRSLAALGRGDFIAFFAGLRPIGPWKDPLLYGLIGFYRIRDCVPLSKIPRNRWHENAHTRRARQKPDDLVVRAEPGRSGRLDRCLVIGEWRDRAYRVRRELLAEWGGLSCKDGYIQRSAVPPAFLQPERFLKWLEDQKPTFIAANNPVGAAKLRTLVYKRTHNGDPDPSGRFGAYDCMGSVRAREYQAVIGVGGIGSEPRDAGIAEKINWIGIGPHQLGAGKRGPIVAFDHFRWFGRSGRRLAEIAPALAAHIYGRNVRSLMTFTQREASEVTAILGLAQSAPPSPALARDQSGEATHGGEPSSSRGRRNGRRGCAPRRRRRC